MTHKIEIAPGWFYWQYESARKLLAVHWDGDCDRDAHGLQFHFLAQRLWAFDLIKGVNGGHYRVA